MRAAVTSERKSAANRRNARASTGPRTAAGKARVARNARRHGLNVPTAADPALSREVEALAQAICGGFAGGAPSPSPQREGLSHVGGASSPSPRMRGEGRDEGALPTVRTRGESPHPDPLPVRTGRGRRALPAASISIDEHSARCWYRLAGPAGDYAMPRPLPATTSLLL